MPQWTYMSTEIESEHDVEDEVVTPNRIQKLAASFQGFQLFSTIVIVGGAMLFLFATLHPSLIFRNNTPTGGDMGAHVWGPAFLRDNLLSNLKLSGWSMDWYSGLPTYRFYMVVPALFILLLDIVLPYGIAFKIIAVIGIIALPACAWAFGKLARFAYPLPELFALAATVFLFDESFTIYGGNIASTMAGEFSFSIALAFAFLGLGFLARGLDDGTKRGAAAICIALSGLSHGIVLIFVFGGAALMVLIHANKQRFRFGVSAIGVAVLLSSFWVMPFLTAHAFMTDMKYEPRPSGATDSFWDMFFPHTIFWDLFVMAFALIGFAACIIRKKIFGMWMGVLCTALFAGVYITRDSLPIIGLLWNPRLLPFMYILRYMLMMIGIYAVITSVVRLVMLERGEKSQHVPAEVTSGYVRNASVWAVAITVLCIFGFRFQQLPFASVVAGANDKSEYSWGPFRGPSGNKAFVDGWARWNFEGYEGKPAYGEYEGIVQTMKKIGEDPELGCGRALWENSGDLNKYGTTMALMLLPFWTDGCIGSQEGLFFEAAGTTPYHFISAAAMSKQSSNPVRELRYDNNDAAIGVRYLQELGVKYFMGFTPEAIAQASQQEGLTEVARSGPWVVYRVANSDVVTPLATQPVVANISSSNPRERWLEVGTSWFQHPETWTTPIADDGPSEWQRIDVAVDESLREGEPNSNNRRVDVVKPATALTPVPLEPVVVSNVNIGEESVRFSVDKVGVPVLVRVSYFPNWKVDGAKGPYRVAPNMMVVIPTSTNVNMHYGWTMLDYVAYLLSFAGIAWIVVNRRRSKQTAE